MNDNQRALLFMVEQHINAARLGDSASILMLSMLVPGSEGKADDEVIAAAESWWSELRQSTKERPQSEQTNFGYVPNRAGTKALVASLPIREIGLSVTEKKDTFLWVPLRKKKPSWRRGAQGIGDCFHPDTIVFGPDDSKPILAVDVGDRVYAGDGSITKVISKQKKLSHRPIVEISVTGGTPLRVTADHKVLICRTGWYGSSANRKLINKSLYERHNDKARSNGVVTATYESRASEWVAAADIKEGDYLLTPLAFHCDPEPKHELLSSAHSRWLFGYFLGNGHASGGSVEIAVSDQKISDQVFDAFTMLGYQPKIGSYREGCGAWRVRVHNKPLVKWLRDTCYNDVKLKVMPSWAIGDPCILSGLLDADGHGDEAKINLDSVSPSLAFGVFASFVQAGMAPTMGVVRRSSGTYPNAKPIRRVTCIPDKKSQRVWRDEQYLYRPVRGITITEGPHEVYDIGVEHKSHSFIADGVIAHNCVSWGNELCCTMALAIQDRLGTSEWVEEAATESIYGGSRVEADGGRLGGYSDGSYGGAAAKFLREWGCVLRLDYSKETGIESHDLRKYSSEKAKAWGNFGCGGEQDAGREDGKLDKIARRYPVEITPIRNTEEAAASIQNGYPVAVCSGVGYGRMKRNADGICEASGRWAHCMMFGGVRWRDGKPDFRQFQSWGDSCSGPDPGIDDEAISACSWWATERDAQRQLDEDDSFAVSFVGGFPPQRIDWADAASTWK